MSALRTLAVLLVALNGVLAFGRFRGRTPKCFKISNVTAPMCQNLSTGYNEMILPNLLEHDSIDEVNRDLSYWLPLVSSGCHPYLKHFLCSVFAPVCIQPTIQPCRSLCSMVQASCEPLMRQHNYSWPSILNCSKYKQNEMCVDIPAPTNPPVPSVCGDDEDSKISLSSIRKRFCDAQFAFRGRITGRKERNGLIILQFKVSRKRTSLSKHAPKKSFARLRLSISSPNQCKGAQKGKSSFLVFGTFKKGKKMIVTHLLKWKKKWKKLGRRKNICAKY